VPGELGVFEPEEEFGTERGSGYGSGDYSPTDWGGKRIAEAVAEPEIGPESDNVGQSLKEEMRVEAVGTEAEVDGELRREMK